MYRHTLLLTAFIAFSWMGKIHAEEKVDYGKQIQPIFMEHCAGCHGEKKGQGKMRLHTAEALKKKWDAGKPEESELYKRLVLPADHKKRMPKKADPLPKEKIDLIGQWIKQGAVLAIGAAVEAKPADAKVEKQPLPEVEPATQEAVDRLLAAGAQVMPLFAGSSLLQVSFARRDEPAGDAEVALLADVAEQIFSLDLSGANVSDQGFSQLAKLTNLMHLHMERSSATDAGLAALAQLGRLEYLNIYDTAVTDAGLAQLEGLKHLRKLYLWDTKVSYDAAEALAKKIPGLRFDIGFNHPVVARKRLTKQMELAKKQIEETTAGLTQAEQRLKQAKKEKESAATRLAEIEKQLKELDGPAQPSGDQADKPEQAKSDAAESKKEEKAETPKEDDAAAN